MAENGPSELGKMIAQFTELTKGRFVRTVTRPLAAEAIARIKSCFANSKSPYGEKWAPVARGGMPLLKTARLSRGFQDASQPGSVRINNPTIYARLQNEGGFVVAKNKPYLSFAIPQQGAPLATRGDKVTKRRRASQSWVRIRMVYIEARQFLPDERGLPPDWAAAMEAVVRKVFAQSFPALNP